MIGLTEILAGLGIALAAVVAAWIGGQRKGAKNERTAATKEALEDEKNRMEAGRAAERDGRDRSPDASLRENDGSW
ncbi:hypothetical protein [Citreimonas sp.]|uniref:hypothetical protein n=1 Tax=Citreimonas sp. TaxID=3036715 RepID=UPI004059FFD5